MGLWEGGVGWGGIFAQVVSGPQSSQAMSALLSIGGGLGLMFATEWRLALLALLLRAPLLARLAVVAGRIVGLYGVAQQRALNSANALAAEALAQALRPLLLVSRRL